MEQQIRSGTAAGPPAPTPRQQAHVYRQAQSTGNATRAPARVVVRPARTAEQKISQSLAAGPPKPAPDQIRKARVVSILQGGGGAGTGLHVHNGDIYQSVNNLTHVTNALGLTHTKDKPVSIDQAEKLLKVQHLAQATVSAPALKILEQTTRPIHAIAGAANQVAAGHPDQALHHALLGIQNKEKTGFGQVLNHGAGRQLPKGVRGGLGFVGDVVADPTTYVTFGSGTVVRKAAEDAVVQKGVKVGVAVRGAEKGSVTVRPPVAVSKVATRVRESRPVQAVGKTLAPDFRPAGAPSEAWQAAQYAARRYRAARSQAARHSTRVGKAIQRAVPKDMHEQFSAAIERAPKAGATASVPFDTRAAVKAVQRNARKQGRKITDKRAAKVVQKAAGRRAQIPMSQRESIAGLPRELRPVALNVRRQNAQLNAPEIQAGLRKAVRRNYLSHQLTPEIRDAMRAEDAGAGKRTGGTAALGAAKGRKYKGSLREIKAQREAEGKTLHFMTDPGAIQAHRLAASGERIAKTRLYDELGQTGRRIKKGSDPLAPGETLYVRRVDPKNGRETLTKIPRTQGEDFRRHWNRAMSPKVTRKRYYALNPQTVDPILEQAARAGKDPNAWSKLQGAWKTAVTIPLPSYHVNNAIGDSILAFEGDAKAKSFGQAGRSLGVMHARNTHAASPAAAAGGKFNSDAAVRIAGKPMKILDLLHHAEQQGVIDTGFAGGELRRLAGGQAKTRVGRAVRPIGDKVRTVSTYRENLPRLATFISALGRGMVPEEAAKWTADHLIDYGNLTAAEQNVLRQVIPFYTFLARNTRIQATKLVTRPGKAATFEKAREEATNTAGLPPNFTHTLQDYQQRGVPVPVSKSLLFYPRSPIEQGLNLATGNPSEFVRNVAPSLGPAKLAGELAFNYSLFFGDKIQKDDSPLVAAPDWAGSLPDPLKKQLGVTTMLDKRTGKQIPAWPAKVDYTAKQLPELNIALGLTTNSVQRTGKTQGMTAAQALGFKFGPYDPLNVQIQNVGKELVGVNNQIKALNTQHGIHKHNATPEYLRLLGRQKALYALNLKLKQQRGDKILPGRQARKGGNDGLPALPPLPALPNLPNLPALP